LAIDDSIDPKDFVLLIDNLMMKISNSNSARHYGKLEWCRTGTRIKGESLMGKIQFVAQPVFKNTPLLKNRISIRTVVSTLLLLRFVPSKETPYNHEQ
jgi:hypothetical protein